MAKNISFERHDTKITFSGRQITPGEVTLLLKGQILFSFNCNNENINRWIKHPLLKGEDTNDIELKQNVFGDKLTTNLFYIHIPKTGGTSIEQAGFEYGIKWGRWMYKHYHKPSEYFMELDIIQGKSLFTSIRNPYTRLVSMIYCPFELIQREPPSTQDEFNKLINKYIHTEVPCYDFVYYKNKKIIPHVIKIEDGLTEQFNKLMAEQNCVARMETHTNKGIEKKYGVGDINPVNIELINNKFEKDFEYFGYMMK